MATFKFKHKDSSKSNITIDTHSIEHAEECLKAFSNEPENYKLIQ